MPHVHTALQSSVMDLSIISEHMVLGPGSSSYLTNLVDCLLQVRVSFENKSTQRKDFKPSILSSLSCPKCVKKLKILCGWDQHIIVIIWSCSFWHLLYDNALSHHADTPIPSMRIYVRRVNLISMSVFPSKNSQQILCKFGEKLVVL